MAIYCTKPDGPHFHRLRSRTRTPYIDISVNDAVRERKLPPELRGQRSFIRSETEINNIAEQRIWQSMKEGPFENLPGKGKPLELSSNSHAAPAEDTLHRIRAKNKCAPAWVELNKEIRSQVNAWRTALKKVWANRCNHSDSECFFLSGKGIQDMFYRVNAHEISA